MQGRMNLQLTVKMAKVNGQSSALPLTKNLLQRLLNKTNQEYHGTSWLSFLPCKLHASCRCIQKLYVSVHEE